MMNLTRTYNCIFSPVILPMNNRVLIFYKWNKYFSFKPSEIECVPIRSPS